MTCQQVFLLKHLVDIGSCQKPCVMVSFAFSSQIHASEMFNTCQAFAFLKTRNIFSYFPFLVYAY